MKATKKIVGAAVALVAAVALSAGSTFAWFASNSTVKASPMKIQATTPANIFIAAGYKSAVSEVTATEITLTAVGDDMNPVALSTADASDDASDLAETGTATSGILYALDAADYTTKPGATVAGTPSEYELLATSSIDGTAGFKWTAEDGATASGASITGYVIGENMTIANIGDAVDLNCTITVGWTGYNDTYKFLRTGFLVGVPGTSGTTYTFVSTSSGASNTGFTDATSDTGPGSGTISYSKLVENFKGNSLVTITALVWFDGNDPDCYVQNAVKASQFTLSYSFSASAIAED